MNVSTCSSFAVRSSSGISHHHRLFDHYFINYNEVFSLKIGIKVVQNVSSQLTFKESAARTAQICICMSGTLATLVLWMAVTK